MLLKGSNCILILKILWEQKMKYVERQNIESYDLHNDRPI
jgi:hypothetical protein